jgi:hypothetical protein
MAHEQNADPSCSAAHLTGPTAGVRSIGAWPRYSAVNRREFERHADALDAEAEADLFSTRSRATMRVNELQRTSTAWGDAIRYAIHKDAVNLTCARQRETKSHRSMSDVRRSSRVKGK